MCGVSDMIITFMLTNEYEFLVFHRVSVFESVWILGCV